MKAWYLLIFIFSLNNAWAEPESYRVLRLACMKKNSLKACSILGQILAKKDPESANKYLQKACDLGKCFKAYQPEENKVETEVGKTEKTKTKLIGQGFEVKVVDRKIASADLDECVDLSHAVSTCRAYRCKLPHPLISDFKVVHHILRQGENCQYTQTLPNGKLLLCLLNDEQVEEFAGLSQLEAGSHLSNLVKKKTCKVQQD